MQLELIRPRSERSNIYKKYGKRLADILIVLLSFIPIGIALSILYILVRIKLGAPVFFTQPRTGHNGEEFNILKFRSMTDDCDEFGVPLPDTERITPFGHFLRSASLDELPELLLILKGEMSFVGPRPLPAIYKDRYSPEQMHRHSVVPGLTGWAQINGRNAVTWEEKFALDLWYIENQSFWLDLRILFTTVKCVFLRDGISQEGHISACEFMGTLETNYHHSSDLPEPL